MKTGYRGFQHLMPIALSMSCLFLFNARPFHIYHFENFTAGNNNVLQYVGKNYLPKLTDSAHC